MMAVVRLPARQLPAGSPTPVPPIEEAAGVTSRFRASARCVVPSGRCVAAGTPRAERGPIQGCPLAPDGIRLYS